ncbi:MAG: hypothetical protein AB7S81_06265 [Bdellovibrionales bacterium]
MAQTYSQRAPFNDWWYWSECLVSRFRTISEIYKENGERERSELAGEWAKRLKDNCMTPVMAARKGMDTDAQKEEVKHLEEEAIYNAAVMFRDLLANFPFISSAIQDFLYVNWEECKWPEEGDKEEIDEDTGLPKKKKRRSGGDDRMSMLFWGPKDRKDEGIRSGVVEDGGLPGILYNLLQAEKVSSNRTPTDYGQVMQSAATQQYIATTAAANQKWENAGVAMNFKPGGSM